MCPLPRRWKTQFWTRLCNNKDPFTSHVQNLVGRACWKAFVTTLHYHYQGRNSLMFSGWMMIVTCCCTKQLNVFLKISEQGEATATLPPPRCVPDHYRWGETGAIASPPPDHLKMLKIMGRLGWHKTSFPKLCAMTHYCATNIFDNLQITIYLLFFRYLF